jgi:hypothetical protein
LSLRALFLPCCSRSGGARDERVQEEDRDNKRVRRSGFDSAPPPGMGAPMPGAGAPPLAYAPPMQQQQAHAGYAPPPPGMGGDLGAGGGGAPPGVGEADFARAVKEAAARAAAIMASHVASAPPQGGQMPGGQSPYGASGGYPAVGAPYGAPPGGGYAPPPAPGGYGAPMPLGGGGGFSSAPPPMAGGYPGAPGGGAVGGYGGGEAQEVLLVNPDVCGKIIGRGGETISSLQAQSGANIKVQSSTEVPHGQPRRVTISGSAGAVAAAKRLVEVRCATRARACARVCLCCHSPCCVVLHCLSHIADCVTRRRTSCATAAAWAAAAWAAA